MDITELASVKELHHAYLVTGSADAGYAAILSLLEKRGIKTTGNPDIQSVSSSEFLVDNARAIASFSFLKPLGDHKYVVVAFSRASTEAQNALLKVIEDAPGNTIFFFSVDSTAHVLPTVRSRCITVTITPDTKRLASDDEAEEFARAGYEDRLSMVEKMTAYISKTQDRGPSRNFVRSLLSLYHDREAASQNLRDLLDADRYMRMQGGSAKAVLSHLAVTLPFVK